MAFLFLAALAAYLTFYLVVAGIAPYGGQNIEVFRFFIYGPGPGVFILLAWWLLSVSLRLYSLIAVSQTNESKSKRLNRIAILMLACLVGLEIAIAMDYQDEWF